MVTVVISVFLPCGCAVITGAMTLDKEGDGRERRPLKHRSQTRHGR
jgi:hypothetical protein